MLNKNTGMVTVMGMLIALEIVLSRFLSISAWNVKIGFSFVPIVIAAILYGSVHAGIVAALGDFLGALMFPIGPYFPGFTLTAFLTGMVFGLFLHGKAGVKNTLAAVGINQFILSLILNTFWISVLYGSPFLPLLGTRVIQSLILAAAQFVVIQALTRLPHAIRNQAAA